VSLSLAEEMTFLFFHLRYIEYHARMYK